MRIELRNEETALVPIPHASPLYVNQNGWTRDPILQPEVILTEVYLQLPLERPLEVDQRLPDVHVLDDDAALVLGRHIRVLQHLGVCHVPQDVPQEIVVIVNTTETTHSVTVQCQC